MIEDDGGRIDGGAEEREKEDNEGCGGYGVRSNPWFQ